VERNDIPDPDTIGDWLRRMADPASGQTGLVRLGNVRDTLNHRLLLRDERTDFTLDVENQEAPDIPHQQYETCNFNDSDNP
jgi:hypothetical protein